MWESSPPLRKRGLPSSRWERSEGETFPPAAQHPRWERGHGGQAGRDARETGGTSHDCAPMLTPVLPKAGKGHLQVAGLKPPNGEAFYPVFHSFCTADAPAVCGCPSESKHLSPAPFPAVLHDLLSAPASLSRKENVRLLFLPLPLLKFRGKQIAHVKRVPFLPLLEAMGLSSLSSSSRAHHSNIWSKSTLVYRVGASELQDICKFGLSFTKSICSIRFM